MNTTEQNERLYETGRLQDVVSVMREKGGAEPLLRTLNGITPSPDTDSLSIHPETRNLHYRPEFFHDKDRAEMAGVLYPFLLQDIARESLADKNPTELDRRALQLVANRAVKKEGLHLPDEALLNTEPLYDYTGLSTKTPALAPDSLEVTFDETQEGVRKRAWNITDDDVDRLVEKAEDRFKELAQEGLKRDTRRSLGLTAREARALRGVIGVFF